MSKPGSHKIKELAGGLQLLTEYINGKTGLDFSYEVHRRRLMRYVKSRLQGERINPGQEFSFFLSQPSEMKLLIDKFLVGETYFCRHSAQFDFLKEWLSKTPIPGPLRIWSAGCATGEEAYSIAIAGRESKREGSLEIFGSDLREDYLHRAREGVFTENSFRSETPAYWREKYFLPLGKKLWKITPSLKRQVKFIPQNLASANYPVEFRNLHIAFCRNVLYYLDEKTGKYFLRQLHSALMPGGLLFLGPSESVDLGGSFLRIKNRGGTIYQKKVVKKREIKRKKKTFPLKKKEALPSKTPLSRSTLLDLINSGEYQRVIDLFSSGDRGELHLEERYYYALALENTGRLQRALEEHSQLLKENPDFVLSYLSRGEIFEKMKKTYSARREYGKILTLLERKEGDEEIALGNGITARALGEVIKEKIK